jgi:hypothetical protein
MILWTIQTEDALSKLEVDGMLRATGKNIMEPSWVGPYQWMADQMEMRLAPPPEPGCFPVWAWYQWENENRRKPDLRAAGHLSKGQKGVRIEFESPDEAALLSDFDLWHYVLNYWYLPESEAEGKEFEAELERHELSFFDTKPLRSPKFHGRIVESWNRIFDLDWFQKNLALPLPRKSIQATLWGITKDQVRNCKHFKSR